MTDKINDFITIDELFEKMKGMAREYAKGWAEEHPDATPEQIDKKAVWFFYYHCLMLGGVRIEP